MSPHNKYSLRLIRKAICFLVFFCLGLKNISKAMQPLLGDAEKKLATVEGRAMEDSFSLLQWLGEFLNVGLGIDGHPTTGHKIDKQHEVFHPMRFNEQPISNQISYYFNAAVSIAILQLTVKNRKFRVPSHHHFLFRLTPF